MLCVSGLVHFPPTEGGPLNYLVRLGYISAKNKWSDLCGIVPAGIVRITKDNLDDTVSDETLFNTLFVKSAGGSKMTEFQKLREDSLLLTSTELLGVGQTGQVRTKEAFMYPVPAVLATVVVSVLVLSALSVFVYCLL